MSICLGYQSLCLFVSLSICLYVYMSICLYVYMFICLGYLLSVYLYICLSIYLSICLSVYLSICLSVYMSICLSVYKTIKPPISMEFIKIRMINILDLNKLDTLPFQIIHFLSFFSFLCFCRQFELLAPGMLCIPIYGKLEILSLLPQKPLSNLSLGFTLSRTEKASQ